MTGVENIDKDQNQNIDLKEIQDALKQDWFLSREENINALADELNKIDKSEISKTLQSSLNNAFDDIINKEFLCFLWI